MFIKAIWNTFKRSICYENVELIQKSREVIMILRAKFRLISGLLVANYIYLHIRQAEISYETMTWMTMNYSTIL